MFAHLSYGSLVPLNTEGLELFIFMYYFEIKINIAVILKTGIFCEDINANFSKAELDHKIAAWSFQFLLPMFYSY